MNLQQEPDQFIYFNGTHIVRITNPSDRSPLLLEAAMADCEGKQTGPFEKCEGNRGEWLEEALCYALEAKK